MLNSFSLFRRVDSCFGACFKRFVYISVDSLSWRVRFR